MDFTNLEQKDRISGLLPWLHDAAERHLRTIDDLKVVATNLAHEQSLLRLYEIKIEAVEKAVLALYDHAQEVRRMANATQERRMEESIDNLVEQANERGINRN